MQRAQWQPTRARPARWLQRARIAVAACAGLAVVVAGGGSTAEPVRRFLRGLSVRSDDDAPALHFRFDEAIRLIGHDPQASGALLRVRLEPLQPGRRMGKTGTPETLRASRGLGVPFAGASYERGVLSVRFERPVAFTVRRGRNPSTLVVALPASEARRGALPATRATTPSEAPTPAPPPPGGETERLLDEARSALGRGDAARAAALFTAVLSRPDGASLAEARELLGVARERSGQLAHAKAEYEAYLREHPEGEGAARVQQRLEALVTAQIEPEPKLRAAAGGTDGVSTLRGSLATYYRHYEFVGDGVRHRASYLLADVALFGAASSERLDVRAGASASYLPGLDGSFDETRVRSLFVEVDDRQGPLFASVGRIGVGSSTALARFDGAQLGFGFAERWRASAVAGYAVDLYTSTSVDTSRPLYGIVLEGAGLADAVDLQLFAVQQRADGFTDRTSLGGEVRYAGERVYGSAFVDYDAHFGSLDALVLSGGWQASDATTLNLFVDYRHVPSLATTNALLGQPLDSLTALDQELRYGDLDAIAEDRTARSTLASVGLTHRLSERFQLAADVAVSELGGTESSAGVEGYPSTGLELWSMFELIATDLTGRGDTAIAALRYIDGRDRERAALLLDWRFRLARPLRAGPRLVLEYRSPDDGESHLYVRPGLGVELRLGPVVFDADIEVEWAEGELGRSGLVGARYEF